MTLQSLVSPLNSNGPCATAERLRKIKVEENKDLQKDRIDCMEAYPCESGFVSFDVEES